jgi:hypothetical protein
MVRQTRYAAAVAAVIVALPLSSQYAQAANNVSAWPTVSTASLYIRKAAQPHPSVTIGWPDGTDEQSAAVLNGESRELGAARSFTVVTETGGGQAIRAAIVNGRHGLATSLIHVGTFAVPAGHAADAPVAASNTVDYVATATEATLTWAPIARVGRYEIWKDGAVVATTAVPRYTDRDVRPKSTIHYTVRATQPAITHDPRHAKDIALGVFAHVPPNLSPGTTIADATASQQRSGFASLTTLPGNTTIRHTTFIPERFVGANILCSGGIGFEDRVFDGDNRGFSAASDRYRTRVDAYVNWLIQFEEIRRRVGESRLYRDNGDGTYTLLETRQASVDGIQPTYFTWQADPFQKRFNVTHEVGNPFCPLGRPAISASYNGYVYRDQRYILWGNHDQAPNYEIYYKDNTSTTFYIVHLWTRSSFQCLVPLRCTQVEYNESN